MITLYSPSDLGALVQDICSEAAEQDLLMTHVPEQVADALIQEAQSLAAAGKETEALDVYDNLIRGAVTARPLIDSRVALALMHKAFLLKKAGRLEEALEVSDEVLDRFGGHREGAVRIIVGAAASLKGATLFGRGRQAAAADALEQAVEFMRSADLRALEPLVSLLHGLALVAAGRSQDALAVLDDVTGRYDIVAEPAQRPVIATAILLKGAIREETDRVLDERDVLLLIESASREELPPGAIHVIARFAARVSPTRMLELIRESHAEVPLLPLVVALQHELGEEPQVAQEVQEVAADIERELEDMRANHP